MCIIIVENALIMRVGEVGFILHQLVVVKKVKTTVTSVRFLVVNIVKISVKSKQILITYKLEV